MSDEPVYRIPQEMLLDYGYIPAPVANNAPHYLYGKGTDCEHQVELPIREERISCPLCASEHEFSLLKRIFLAPYCEQVWWSHYNPTTGRMESDRKAMQRHLTDHSHRISDELGIGHEYKRIDPSEVLKERAAKGADRNGKTVEGALVSTHNRAVAEGRKQSKGKFVH